MEPSVEQRRLAGGQSARYLATTGVPEGLCDPWPYGRHRVVPLCNTRKHRGWGGVVCLSPWRLEPGRHGDPCAHWSMDRLGCGGMPLLRMKPKICSHTYIHNEDSESQALCLSLSLCFNPHPPRSSFMQQLFIWTVCMYASPCLFWLLFKCVRIHQYIPSIV